MLEHLFQHVCSSFFVQAHFRLVSGPFLVVVAAFDSCQRPLSFRGCSLCLRALVVAVETHLCVLALLSVKEGHLFGPE